MKVTERNKVVAKIIVPEIIRVRKQDYETASWWTELDLVPGEYELKSDSRHGLAYMLWGSIPGLVVKGHFPSGFGGFYYHNAHQDRIVGRTENYSIFYYDYTLTESHTRKDGIKIELCN